MAIPKKFIRSAPSPIFAYPGGHKPRVEGSKNKLDGEGKESVRDYCKNKV